MRNRIRHLFLFAAIACSPQTGVAAQAMEQYSVLAALTLNFARFTQWPDQAFAANAGTLNVCLVGDNVVQRSFEAIDGKTAGARSIKIVNAERLRNLTQCHVLFIADLEKNLLLQVFADIKSHPVLTIGEAEEFMDSGGMVGMINTDNKIQLYVDLGKVKLAGLTISSNLLKLANIIGNAAN